MLLLFWKTRDFLLRAAIQPEGTYPRLPTVNSAASPKTLMRIGQPEFVVRHMTAHRPIDIAPPAAPHQQDRFTLDGRFQSDSSEGAAVWTRFRDPNGDPTIRTHKSSCYYF